MKFSVDIWHNILWSKYKGAVFSELYEEAVTNGLNIRFFQIAEIENDRRGLGSVDFSFHSYPFELISEGAYQDIPKIKLCWILCQRVFISDADLIVIAGYHKLEYWVQLFATILRSKKAMVFCDSTYYDQPRHIVKDFFKTVFFYFCDGFFCYGCRSMEYLLSYHVPKDKISVRCQAAALSPDYSVEAALAARMAVLERGEPRSILYVGRLAQEKNLGFVLNAMGVLFSEFADLNLRIVGAGPDREILERKAAALGITERVHFLGAKSGESLYREYTEAACLLLSSVSEPWGLVVNEALSFGCPVVVSDRCGCVPELVHTGRTGFTFDPLNEVDLMDQLRRALSPDFDKRRAATEAITLMQDFTPQAAAKAICVGLQKVMSSTLLKRGRSPSSRITR